MDILEYRIVKTRAGDFMPQRGINGHIDGVSGKFYWVDGVPHAAPALELAQTYVASMQQFDKKVTEGEVVWKSE